MAENVTKRKHQTLSLSRKMEILQKLDSGLNVKSITSEYNIGRATIYDIKKNRDMIESFANAPGMISRKTLKPGDYALMEDALYSWYLEERSRNTPLTGDIIRQKSLIFYENIYKNNHFKASNGWYQKFKSRYGIESGESGGSGEKLVVKCSTDRPGFFEEVMMDGFYTNETCSNSEVVKSEVKSNSTKSCVKSVDALSAVDLGIRWAEENNIEGNTLLALRKLRDAIVKKITSETGKT